mgnify:CR=1 FL=1
MTNKTIILVFVIILIALLVWGLIGSSKAAEIGINCDIGIGKDGSVFCWTCHQNIIGDIGDTINQIINK